MDDPTFAGRGYAKIPHAKSAKDAEGVIFNFGFLIFPAFAGRAHARIPHAKSAKGAKGVKGMIFNFGFFIFDWRRVSRCDGS